MLLALGGGATAQAADSEFYLNMRNLNANHKWTLSRDKAKDKDKCKAELFDILNGNKALGEIGKEGIELDDSGYYRVKISGYSAYATFPLDLQEFGLEVWTLKVNALATTSKASVEVVPPPNKHTSECTADKTVVTFFKDGRLLK